MFRRALPSRPALRRVVASGSGWLLPGLALAVTATGMLPPADLRDTLARTWPVLAFLVAVTVVAELADAAGLFEAAADVAARAGRGRVPVLWLLVVALAALTTVLLSLDTAAVLLTPVVLALAQRLSLPPLPFALATVWLANTASLLLPVSNLTNLLAVERTGWSAAGWAGRMWAPALASVLVTAAVLWLLTRRDLRGRYPASGPNSPHARHRGLLALAGAGCLGLGIAVGVGVPPWLGDTAVGAAVAVGFARAEPERLTRDLLPLRLTIGTLAVFLLVAAAERHGLGALLQHAAASGPPTQADWPGLLRVAGVGAVAANAVNNLPAYLAVEPAVAGHPLHLLALVIGVNAGPLVTPWASLATLLWRDRCRARGVTIGSVRLAGYGLLLTIPLIAITTLLLSWGI
jgi:arsenical pump membrane protein